MLIQGCGVDEDSRRNAGDASETAGLGLLGDVSIVDDGDAGYSAPGWVNASGAAYSAYFGSDIGYVLGAPANAAATWTVSGLAVGTYRVSATWTPHLNRATNAAYSVLNGAGSILATKTVNQELAPASFADAGTKWETLGTVTLTADGNLVVKLAGQGNEYLLADAVRFESVTAAPPSPPPPPAGAVTVVDDGDAGYSAPGWLNASGAAYSAYFGSDIGYVLGAPANAAATWTVSGLAVGTYRVSATWTPHINRATNAAYSVLNGAGSILAAKTVNQELAPASFADAGTKWEDLGTVTLTADGNLVVKLAGQGNEYLLADAVRFEKVTAAPPSPPSPAAVMKFDFGTLASPVMPGYTQVTEASVYSPARGFGWTTGQVNSFDRGTGSHRDRDFNFTSDGTFVANVANGTYTVHFVLGDTGAYSIPHDDIAIYLEGNQVDTVTTPPTQVVTRTYTVTVTDGQLTVRVRDLGGVDPNAVINALTVDPA